MGGIKMSDYLSRRLENKKKKEKVETFIIDDDDASSEIATTISQRTIEKLQIQVKASDAKYKNLRDDYGRIKDALEKHAMILSNFSNWVNTLDLMLSEGKDVVKILRDQIEALTEEQDKLEKETT